MATEWYFLPGGQVSAMKCLLIEDNTPSPMFVFFPVVDANNNQYLRHTYCVSDITVLRTFFIKPHECPVTTITRGYCEFHFLEDLETGGK